MVATYTRLDIAMTTLGYSSTQLAQECAISNSLISRWRNGTRKLTVHSDAALALATTLVTLDKSGKLDPLLEPYRIDETDKQTAMWLYLVESDLPPLSTSTEEEQQQDGEYLSQQYHLFGRKGFQKGALLMLDYIDQLPESQEIIVCALSDTNELWHNEVMFALRFLRKIKRALSKQTNFTVVENCVEHNSGSPHFSNYWLLQNLKGTFKGRVFRGSADECFIAAIPGYWSGTVEKDPTAKDGIITTFSTDPRIVRQTVELCKKYISECAPPSQYDFLRSPEGEEYDRRWSKEADHRLTEVRFSTISRIPLFGVMTEKEFGELKAGLAKVEIPSYIFGADSELGVNSHYFILCADSLQAALQGPDVVSDPLSSLLGFEVRLSSEIVCRMVQRLIRAMESIEDMKVALVPKKAFARIGMEFVTWEGAMAIGWLQDGSESLLDVEPAVVASFDDSIEYIWSTLSKKWKDQEAVFKTLSQWLREAGKFAGGNEPVEASSDLEELQDTDDSTAEPGFPYLQIFD